MSPKNENLVRTVAVMGSTGSIGRQTLDIISSYPDRFKAGALTAHCNWQLLAEQAKKLRPEVAVIADPRFYPDLKNALKGTGIEVLAGKEGLIAAATLDCVDTVVGALVGYSGLPSTIAALEAGKRLALANKETLVVAGELISAIVKSKGETILPVDSEHSAIFQCLSGEDKADVRRIILTASGGPFRTFPASRLKDVTIEQTLAHPNWDMGAKVTVDSATMMNKGFEMIEARWLFDKEPDDISVAVHPESVVHSMVEFVDGSVKAQLGLPDMRLPIAVALAYPRRLDLLGRMKMPSLDLCATGALTFEEPDTKRFPLLKLAYDAAREGGLVPALMNAANEVAVKAFLEKQINFTEISETVIKTVDLTEDSFKGMELNLSTIEEAHNEGTEIALKLIKNK